MHRLACKAPPQKATRQAAQESLENQWLAHATATSFPNPASPQAISAQPLFSPSGPVPAIQAKCAAVDSSQRASPSMRIHFQLHSAASAWQAPSFRVKGKLQGLWPSMRSPAGLSGSLNKDWFHSRGCPMDRHGREDWQGTPRKFSCQNQSLARAGRGQPLNPSDLPKAPSKPPPKPEPRRASQGGETRYRSVSLNSMRRFLARASGVSPRSTG